MPHITAGQRAVAWQQAGVSNHERHQLLWVAANIEELKAMLLDKLLENAMGRYANSVTVIAVQNEAESDEWLHVSSGPNNLNGDMEPCRNGCLKQILGVGFALIGWHPFLRDGRVFALRQQSAKTGAPLSTP